jgi:hypothetical protein
MAPRYRVNAPDVVFESFDEEILAIDLRNGSYFSLRGGAVAAWPLLSGGWTVEETVAELAGRFGDGAPGLSGSVRTFAAGLEEAGLIVRAGDEAPPPGSRGRPGSGVLRWSEPVIERYTDMQDLLLTDPIHDVDLSGWPSKAKHEPPPA